LTRWAAISSCGPWQTAAISFPRLHLLLSLVALELLRGLHADHVDLVAGCLEAIVGDAELGILEALS